jgi:hypothetical protein
MMKKLTSKTTLLYKKLFPFIWFGFLTVFDAGDDVQKHLAITERGRSYLRHRDTAIDF